MAQMPNPRLTRVTNPSHSQRIGNKMTATAKDIKPLGDVSCNAPVAKDVNRNTKRSVQPQPSGRVASRPMTTTPVVKIASQ